MVIVNKFDSMINSNFHPTWHRFLPIEFLEEMLEEIKEAKKNNFKVSPKGNFIFLPFSYSYDDVSVVFVAPACYSSTEADGFAFGQSQYAGPLREEAKVLITEITADHNDEFNSTLMTDNFNIIWGDNLAEQGVLLLNNQICNYGDWSPFMRSIYSAVAEKDFVIWVLFEFEGREFVELRKIIPSTHKLFYFDYPGFDYGNSPYSIEHAILGSRIFSRINKELSLNNKPKIDWL